MEIDKVVELVQKLLALSHSSNENEAAVAMGKARELLIKHNLDMATFVETEPKNNSFMEIPLFSIEEKWEAHLVAKVARHFFCRAIWQRGNQCSLVVGKADNLLVMVETYYWLRTQMSYFVDNAKPTNGDIKTQSWRTSYLVGISFTLDDRLKRTEEELPQGEVKALVVRLDKEVEYKYKELHPNPVSFYTRPRNGNAFDLGRQDGWKVNTQSRRNLALGSG